MTTRTNPRMNARMSGRKMRSAGSRDWMDLAHDAWLAGLGALALAGEAAETAFGKLEEKGRNLETPDFAALRQDVAHGAENLIAKVRDSGSEAERGVTRAIEAVLDRVGVPTRKDVRALNARLQELTKELDALVARA